MDCNNNNTTDNSEYSYNKEELDKKTTKQLIDILKKYSLKYVGVSNENKVKSILDYQNFRSQLQLNLVENNTINTYHRGHVDYKLPVLIICDILKLLWYSETRFNVNIYSGEMKSTYKMLLSLSLLSKEFFKYISKTLFDSIILGSVSQCQALKQTILSPLSPLKRITTLVLRNDACIKLLKSSAVELSLIFNDVTKLTVYEISMLKCSINDFQKMGLRLPHLETLRLVGGAQNTLLLGVLKEYPLLTSLDLSEMWFDGLDSSTFSFNMFSPKIISLKLPYPIGYIGANVNDFGPLSLLRVYGGHIGNRASLIANNNLTKLILTHTLNHFELKDNIRQFLLSSDCKLTYFGFRFHKEGRGFSKEWFDVIKLSTIVTLEFLKPMHYNYSDRNFNHCFTVTVPLLNIKKIIINDQAGSTTSKTTLHRHKSDTDLDISSEFLHYRTKSVLSCFIKTHYNSRLKIKQYFKRVNSADFDLNNDPIIKYNPSLFN